MRWRVSNLDWKVNCIPGLYQIADVGTKPLQGQRLEVLKGLMNMGAPEQEDIRDTGNVQEIPETLDTVKVMEKINELKMALLIGMVASHVQAVKGEKTEE